jgi:hypothetical protein
VTAFKNTESFPAMINYATLVFDNPPFASLGAKFKNLKFSSPTPHLKVICDLD